MKSKQLIYAIGILYAAINSNICTAMGNWPENSYHNPILATEPLADPHMIRHGDQYYLYGTFTDGSLKGGSDHYDVFVSHDMESWEKHGPIFSKDTDTLWAPDVFFDPHSEQFYLYYSLEMDIGIAVSDSPLGPFIDQGIIIENAIDAHMFYDNGNYYLYYASVDLENEFDMFFRFIEGILDGSGSKAQEDIWVQPMASPSTPVGDPIHLLGPDAPWEKGLLMNINEGPWMFKQDNIYYLMYSGNTTIFSNYAVGYATSDNPLGPFQKHEQNPILKSHQPSLFRKGIFNPGHHSVITEEDGTHWIIYHQKVRATDIGFSERYTCKDELTIVKPGVLEINGTPMKKIQRGD